MSADDLASLPSLSDDHRKVLAEELGVATCRALVLARRPLIVEAMRRREIEPRVTPAKVAVWQDEAREQLAAASGPMPDWERVASFAVVFDQREDGGATEQRLAVEQTELEGAAPERVWPSWDCSDLCAWMHEQVAAAPEPPAAPRAGAPRARGKAARTPPEVTIDAVWLVDHEGEREVPGGTDPMRAQLTCTDETRLAVAVTAPAADQLVNVCVRIYGGGSVGWNLPDPLEVKGSGRATFALSGLPVGRHVGSWVLAAASGSGATHAEFLLPVLERLST